MTVLPFIFFWMGQMHNCPCVFTDLQPPKHKDLTKIGFEIWKKKCFSLMKDHQQWI